MNVNITPSVNKDNCVEFLIEFKNNGIMNNKNFIANSALKNYLVRVFRENKSKCENNLKKGESPVWKGYDDDDYLGLNLVHYGINLGLSVTCFYFTLDLLRLEDYINPDDVKDKRNKLIVRAIDYIARAIYQGIDENSYKEILDNFDTYYQPNEVSSETILIEAKHKFTVNGLDEYAGIRTVDFENDNPKRPSYKDICDTYEKGYSVSNLNINILGDVEKSDTLIDNVKRIVNGVISSNKENYKDLIFPQDTVVNKTLSLVDEKNIMGYSAVDFELPFIEGLNREIDLDKDTSIFSMKVLRSLMPKLNNLKDFSIPLLIGSALSRYKKEDSTSVEIDYYNLIEIENDKSEIQIKYIGANETDEVKEMLKALKDKFNIDNEDKLFNLKKLALSDYREDNWALKWVIVYTDGSESDFIKSLSDITLDEFNEFIDNLIELTTVQIRYYDFDTNFTLCKTMK